MKSVMTIISRGAQTFITLATLFAIVVSFVFCFFALEPMGGMSHAGGQDQPFLPIHADHMQILSSGVISQTNSFVVLSAILFALIAFAFVVFWCNPQPLLQPGTYQRRRRLDDMLTNHPKLYWLSRFVRSPEFLKPA